MDVDLLDLIQIEIDDDEKWLAALDGEIPLTQIIDANKLLRLMNEFNIKYSMAMGVCPFCRADLQVANELDIICPNDCI